MKTIKGCQRLVSDRFDLEADLKLLKKAKRVMKSNKLDVHRCENVYLVQPELQEDEYEPVTSTVY